MTSTTTVVRVGTTRWFVATLAPLLVLCAACSEPETPVDPLAELRARPSLEQAVDRYEQMQRRVQTEITAVVGPRDWSDQTKPTEGNCLGQFSKVYDGERRGLPRYGFDGGFTAEQWPRVADAVNRVLREYGFSTEGLVNTDRNGFRTISGIEQSTGATFEFASERNTNFVITTGCHLPASKKATG